MRGERARGNCILQVVSRLFGIFRITKYVHSAHTHTQTDDVIGLQRRGGTVADYMVYGVWCVVEAKAACKKYVMLITPAY